VKLFLESIAHLWRPHGGQRRFLLARAPVKVLACGRRWGKTEACAAEVAATLQDPEPTRWLLVAPTMIQARILFDRVLQFLVRLGHRVEARVSPFPSFDWEGHRVMARSGHRADSLRGDEATHVVVDEAAFVPESLIDDVLAPMLATTDGRLTLVSTPNGFNHFWRSFLRGQERRRDTWSRRGPSRENPRVARAFLARQRERISDRSYRTEYEAEFVEMAGAVIRNELIEAAISGEAVPFLGGDIAAGIDWAQTHDFTALAIVRRSRDQIQLVCAERMPRGDYPAMVEGLARRIEAAGVTAAVADSTGLGGEPTQMLRRRLRIPVSGYDFNAASKGLLIEGLATAFERRTFRMAPHPDLVRELRSYRATPTPSGGIRYAGAGREHDDLVVAVALALHALPYAQTVVSRWR